MRSLGRSLRRAFQIPVVVLLFGALWGTAQGIWFVAPSLVRMHRINPASPSEWLVLDLALIVACAGLGAVLSVFSALFIVAWALIRRRAYREPAWAAALALAPMLPLAYLVAALLIERWYFGRTAHFASYTAATAAAVAALCTAGLARTYRAVASAEARPPVSRLASILVLVTALGAIGLPFRLPSPPAAEAVDDGLLAPVAGHASITSPLLLIGLDSGNWDTIRPLVAQGSLPTFARLLADGVHGDVAALWPPYWSAPAWAAILTGRPREEVGVYADLMVRAPGLPLFDAPLEANIFLHPFSLMEWMLHRHGVLETFPPPRTALRRPPVWELLSRAGVETGVIRFGFTYPADEQAGFVVSDRVGHDTWDVAEVNAANEDRLVAPPALRTELLAPFSLDIPFDERAFARVLPGSPRPRTPYVAFAIQVLRTALDIDTRTITAAERVLQLRPSLPFLAVYLGGFDNACHAFWWYRFPDAYADDPPPSEDVAEFHGVIDRYLEFLDGRLAGLIAAYPKPPNVIVVSDHGHGRSRDEPMWAGWHAGSGIFIGAGPDFPHQEAPLAVSYYDIVPTIADVMGFAAPRGMRGSSVLRR